jgi:DNA-binding transcriptional LysR family regulator
MSDLRRKLSSSNALFALEAAGRTGSFTAAAAELNVTQPAVSRMLGRFESHLGVRLFERTPSGALLTEDGELLYRRVAEGFRAIDAGLREIEMRRSGTETVTLSVSSAFTTHWLMPRIDKLRRCFPTVDLRFQLIPGSLRGPVENVDLGMRFLDGDGTKERGSLVMKEVMLPVCSPSYLAASRPPSDRGETNTVINLADSPSDWATRYSDFGTGRAGPPKSLSFSDYAVVVQAALLGQGIALGWITVVSHWLLSEALVPASETLTTTRRECHLIQAENRPLRPVVVEIRDWIVGQMRSDIETIDNRYPRLGLFAASY